MEKSTIKESIFNYKKHSLLKRLIVILYTLSIFILGWVDQHFASIGLAFIGICISILFFMSRLIIYKPKNQFVDITVLLVFMGVFIYSIYTIQTNWSL